MTNFTLSFLKGINVLCLRCYQNNIKAHRSWEEQGAAAESLVYGPRKLTPIIMSKIRGYSARLGRIIAL